MTDAIINRVITLRGTQVAIDQVLASINQSDTVSAAPVKRGRKPGQKTGPRDGSLPHWMETAAVGDHCWTAQPAAQVASTALRTSARVQTEKWCCVHAGTERLVVLTKVIKLEAHPRPHTVTCPAYGNYQPPYEECDCALADEPRAGK